MKVVIIGGVAGGAGTAARLRRNDEFVDIVLFEKGGHISFANCGLPYYIGGVITDEDDLLLQTPDSFFARFRVDVRVGQEVLSVDTGGKKVLVHNHALGMTYSERYDKLVLSPGASPIVPALPGMERSRVFTLRSIPDMRAIKEYIEHSRPQTCAVIGAGFIGLELAENIAELGVAVTIVEAAAHVMAPLDMDMACIVHNYIRSKGMGLVLGRRCVGMDEKNIRLDDGTEQSADMVILSVGVRPETAFLRDSGIALGSRGEILVDECMHTSVPDVFALGDAASVKHVVHGGQSLIPLASPANKQARIVADNLCGGKVEYKGSQGTSIMKFFDLAVAVTGEKEESLSASGTPYLKSITTSPSNADYYPGGGTMTIKLLFTQQGNVLGAQIVGGAGVDKRIDLLAVALRSGLTVYDLQEMELSYAPPFSSAKDPVNMAGYVAANILEGRMTPFFPDSLAELSQDALKLDVRTAEEYEEGHIEGFVNIPLNELRERLLEIKDEAYVTCQIGLRGYIAERILAQHGVKVNNLAGGYRLYKEIKDDLAPRERHR